MQRCIKSDVDVSFFPMEQTTTEHRWVSNTYGRAAYKFKTKSYCGLQCPKDNCSSFTGALRNLVFDFADNEHFVSTKIKVASSTGKKRNNGQYTHDTIAVFSNCERYIRILTCQSYLASQLIHPKPVEYHLYHQQISTLGSDETQKHQLPLA